MKTFSRALMVATFGLAIGLAPAAFGQDPPQPSPQPPTQEPAAPPAPEHQAPSPSDQAAEQTATGELVSVDTEAKTITVKKDDGTEMEFSYDDTLEVTGAQQEIAGLATVSGSQVTVTYTSDMGKNKASKIDVRAKELQ